MIKIPPHKKTAPATQYQEVVVHLQQLPNAMGVSMLHGFLTGIALGPASVLSKPWLADALGLPPDTDIPDAAKRAVESAIDELTDQFQNGQLHHVLRNWNGQSVYTLQQWGQGFVKAYQLATQDWDARCQQDLGIRDAVNQLKALSDPNTYANLISNSEQLTHDQLYALHKRTPFLIDKLVAAIPMEEPEEDLNALKTP